MGILVTYIYLHDATSSILNFELMTIAFDRGSITGSHGLICNTQTVFVVIRGEVTQSFPEELGEVHRQCLKAREKLLPTYWKSSFRTGRKGSTRNKGGHNRISNLLKSLLLPSLEAEMEYRPVKAASVHIQNFGGIILLGCSKLLQESHRTDPGDLMRLEGEVHLLRVRNPFCSSLLGDSKTAVDQEWATGSLNRSAPDWSLRIVQQGGVEGDWLRF